MGFSSLHVQDVKVISLFTNSCSPVFSTSPPLTNLSQRKNCQRWGSSKPLSVVAGLQTLYGIIRNRDTREKSKDTKNSFSQGCRDPQSQIFARQEDCVYSRAGVLYNWKRDEQNMKFCCNEVTEFPKSVTLNLLYASSWNLPCIGNVMDALGCMRWRNTPLTVAYLWTVGGPLADIMIKVLLTWVIALETGMTVVPLKELYKKEPPIALCPKVSIEADVQYHSRP